MWAWQVFTLEMRKVFSYRIDFWTQFAAHTLVWLGVSYFLWDSIFTHNQITSIGGYDFATLMLYYLLTASAAKIMRGEDIGQISREIYQGELSRYLIYPISFFQYKFICHLAHSFLHFTQLCVALVLFVCFFGIPSQVEISMFYIAIAILFLFLSCYLHFCLAAILELLSFWLDNVWSLLLMLRFSSNFLGGGLIPLTLFPEWAQTALYFSPFPYFLSFSSQIFLQKVTHEQIVMGFVVMFIWIILFHLSLNAMWKRGIRQYSGVGI